MEMTTTQNIAIVPYWLNDNPHDLEKSDHLWWLDHLNDYDITIFIGPYIKTNMSRREGKERLSICSNIFEINIIEIFRNTLVPLGIRPSDITLYWHVLEAASTCRVSNINILDCPRICVIGDTHHMQNPISSLYAYLFSQSFTHICCSHNQYNPFFSAVLGLKAIDFPFTLPNDLVRGNNWDGSTIRDQILYYYGSLVSRHHLHRSRIVNELLSDTRINNNFITKSRMSFSHWKTSVQRPHHNVTCSLNGTFSFQTFLPMLGGACIYTDPISDSNWVGTELKGGYNCIVYNSSSDIIEQFLKNKKSLEKTKLIGTRAHNSISKYLKPIKIMQQDWIKGIPEERILTTNKEAILERTIKSHIKDYGVEDVIRLVKIFEICQEIHRLEWAPKAELKIFLSHGQINNYIISCQHTLTSMLNILPRYIIKNSLVYMDEQHKITRAKLVVNIQEGTDQAYTTEIKKL